MVFIFYFKNRIKCDPIWDKPMKEGAKPMNVYELKLFSG